MHSQTRLIGHIADSTKKPLPLVTVSLFQDNRFVGATASDEEGDFQLVFECEKNKAYSVRFSLIGYLSIDKNVGLSDTSHVYSIVLLQTRTVLSNVTVTAKKPLVTRKADRYTIDVENSFLANGNSGLEVLQKSPGIWVDNNGSIRIKGSQPVLVMINDVVQRMGTEELSEYLKTLKSEDISKIEVIANPPSEFEASGTGGLIHIVLKKARKNGLNASANAQYRQQADKPYTSIGSSLDYKLTNLYLLGSVTLTKDVRSIFATTYINYPDLSIYRNHANRNDNTDRQQYRIGFVYDLHANHSIGLQSVSTFNDQIQSFITDGYLEKTAQTVASTSYSSKSRNVHFNSITLNYSWKMDSMGSALKMIADYSSNAKKESNYFSTVYVDPLQNITYKNNAPNSTNAYSIQADYNKVMKHKMEIKNGIKYISIKRNNEIWRENLASNNWVMDYAQSNHFIYDEEVLMFYSSIEKNIKRTNVKVGVRGEETFSRGNSISSNQQFSNQYFGLFPSLFIAHTFNESSGDAVYINYTRRLQRPTLLQLNPARLQFDSYTAQTGNPNLQPQYSHNVQTGYNFLRGYSIDIYFVRIENMIGLLANPGSNNTIEYQSENLNNSTEYGLNINAAFKVIRTWSCTNSFSLQHLSYSINDYHVNQSTFSIKSIHTAAISNVMDIDAIANYSSSYVSSNYAIPSMGSLDVGFAKKMCKNRGRIRLYFSDVFNTLCESEVTDYKGTHIDFYQKRPTRTVSLSFNYSFVTGKKFSSKKIEQNSDEKNRIGN